MGAQPVEAQTVATYGIRDDSEGWYCACGTRLWPDCDVSLASVGDAFTDHLAETHPQAWCSVHQSWSVSPQGECWYCLAAPASPEAEQ